jgi:4-hydroxy-3-methylbut-2-enyl diphosphate reductase IspH
VQQCWFRHCFTELLVTAFLAHEAHAHGDHYIKYVGICLQINHPIYLQLSCGVLAAFASADLRCAAPALHRAQTTNRHQFLTGVAATAEAVINDADGASGIAVADTQQQTQQQRKTPQQQQERAIVVGEKPAANSLLRRLEQVCLSQR